MSHRPSSSIFCRRYLAMGSILLSHFNPPPKASSYQRDNEVLHQRGKSLGAEQCVQNFKDKGMQTQCEMKISPKYLFSQKLNSLLLHGLDMAQFIVFKWN
jgi:hypothetical protein